MSQIKGVVKAVAKSGKGINIDDVWYNSGKPMFNPSLRGQTLSFSVNAKNFLEGGFEVDESAPAAKPTAKAGGGKKFVDNSVGMGIGMALNNACQFAIAENRGYDEEFIRDTAISIYELAETLKHQAQDGNFELGKKVSQAVAEEDDDLFV